MPHFTRLLAVLTLFTALNQSHVTANLAPKLRESAWSNLPDYPLSVLEAGGAVLRDSHARRYIVVFGGYLLNTGLQTTNHVYALRLTRSGFSGSWFRLPDMPTNVTHTAQAAVASRIYMCGGFAGTAPGRVISECWIFDMKPRVWERLPDLPERRGGGGLAFVGGKRLLLYAGGTFRKDGSYRGEDKPHAWSLSLRSASRQWLPLSDMPNTRNHMAAVAVGGRQFFVGGQHLDKEEAGNQPSVHEYVIARDEWVERAPLPRGLGHISASTFAYWNGIFVMGGIANGRQFRDDVLWYDTRADAWRMVGRMPRRVQSPVCDKFGRRLVCVTGLGTPGSGRTGFWRRVSLPMQL